MSNQIERDVRIAELAREANGMYPQIENLIDELKSLGEHSLDGGNALRDIREKLKQLAAR